MPRPFFHNGLQCTALALVLVVAACSGGEGETTPEQEVAPLSIVITSPAFTEGTTIPEKHTCDGADLSPALQWSGVPEGTRSLALIADDPDAPGGTWVHWVLYAIPPDTVELKEGVPATAVLPTGAKHGVNDFTDQRRQGYGGPCPPRGTPHRYYFKVYAVNTVIDLAPGATKKNLEGAMKGHILAQGQLMGRYQRK